MPRCRWLLTVAIVFIATDLTKAQEDPVLGKTRQEWLTILAKDDKPRMRKAAVVALDIIGTSKKEIFEALLKALTADADEDVRVQVVTTLSQLTPKELRDALPTLADVLKDDKSAPVRARTASLLGNLGELALPALAKLTYALGDSDANVRAAAAEAIGKMGPEAAKTTVTPLLPLLKDTDPSVRFAAVLALGQMGPDAGFALHDLLQVMEKDMADHVRREAIRSLAAVGGASSKFVMPAVLKALTDDKSVNVRRQLAVSLNKLGDLKPVIGDVFAILKKEKDRPVRLYLVRAIPAGLGSGFKDHVKDYAEWLPKEPEGEVRLAIIQELGALGPDAKEGLPALIVAESDVVLQVRDAAKEAILQVKGMPKKDNKK